MAAFVELVDQFESNPFLFSRELRDLRTTDTALFQQAALRKMASAPDGPGVRFLATLVPLTDPVLEVIANPDAFTLDESKRILDLARQNDPQAEAKLLRLLGGHPHRQLSPGIIDRILDLADAFEDATRLVPTLMQVYRTANPVLRARLTLSLGRLHRNREWIDERMKDHDAIIRAHTVESNWGMSDELATYLFKLALRDPDAQVVGKGAAGLYFAGEVRSLAIIGRLLENKLPHLRAAGLHAISEIRDVRFQNMAATLIADRDPEVRRQLLPALNRLKRASESRAHLAELVVDVRDTGSRVPGSEEVCYTVELLGHGGFERVASLRPLDFAIYEDQQPVLDYRIDPDSGIYRIYFIPSRQNCAVRITAADYTSAGEITIETLD